jgi:hypothetical protein
MSVRTVALLSGLALVGCSTARQAGAPDASGSEDNCVAAAKYIYTLDVNNTLSQFDPQTKQFVDMGTLACEGAEGNAPYSMSVDRSAHAWVVYTDGALYTVDIVNGLQCTRTAWASPDSLGEFGMGFSTDVSGGANDTLFVAAGTTSVTPIGTTSNAKLAAIDTGTLDATVIGALGGAPELTGTSSAQLWGWFPDASSPTIEQLDKTSGAAITTFRSSLSGLAGTPHYWAFAFWGGDFWVFLQRSLPEETATQIYQVDGTTGAIVTTTPTGTRSILGAGVSTCAPLVIL